MHGSEEIRRRPLGRRLRVGAALLGLAGLVVATGLPVATASAARTQRTRHGTVIDASDGPFGPMLVDGSAGPFQGTALYTITSDYPGHVGCTTKVVNVLGSKLACTGSVTSNKVEWPALLTSGAPVAGKGVSKSELGELKVKGLGEQVTYDGHPLYLFDSTPGIVTGEDWDEATLPPWHGVWYLVDPSGGFLPWTPTLSTVTLEGRSVLAAFMMSGGGLVLYPVYSYANGISCTTTCADVWPPLLTSGTAGTTGGASESKVGTVTRGDGSKQVTYHHKALYLDSNEAIALGPNGVYAVGSGNGEAAPSPFTGDFEFVTP